MPVTALRSPWNTFMIFATLGLVDLSADKLANDKVTIKFSTTTDSYIIGIRTGNYS